MVGVVQLLTTVLTVLVLAHVLLSYVLDPFHPLRQAVDSLVAPMLNPIRRVLPPLGMLDFSPFVLLILVQVVGGILVQVLATS
jgi:YggT family protein